MPTATLSFTNEIQASVQVGDIVLYGPTPSSAGINISTSDIVYLGACLTISSDRKTMTVDYAASTALPIVAALPNASFILFSKDKYVNPSGALGYYAKVSFKNNSTEEAELFSVNAGVFESSK